MLNIMQKGSRQRGYPRQETPAAYPAFQLEEDGGVEIDPRAHYASIDQVWDAYTINNWLTIQPSSRDSKAHTRLIFKAFKRAYGQVGPSSDDHTWIEIKSRALIKLLRSEKSLKGVDGLSASPPGVDARDLFLRLERLKPLVSEPNVQVESEALPLLAPKPKQDGSAPGAKDAPNAVAPTGEPPALAEEPATGPTEESALTASEQLWVLLRFIETHFRETVEELERLKADGYMSYRLLWAICAPGSVVEVKDDATEHPMGLRVESWEYSSDGKKFTVRGVTYVWGGKVFRQDVVPIEIGKFKGLMKADQVAIKVMSEQTRKHLTERGRLYQKYSGMQHLNYDSFITIVTQYGISKLLAKGRVMVDAEGYSRYNLNVPGEYKPSTSWGLDGPSPFSIASPYAPTAPVSPPHGEECPNDGPLPDDILCLTPPTHKGWSFGVKAWGLFLVANLCDIVFNDLAFDQLVIKPEYKKTIKALIDAHASGAQELAKDLIAGKGGGTVMVFHGKPGTGKTLTAEAISEHLKCPLYMVSSGELGTYADKVEKRLHHILQMTATWKAVVLIDEADVFLETRSTYDVMRNSMASVFLRLLEYHTGVMILTTNRIRTFDKAFVSRFSIALHYPDLDQDSRSRIWKEFLTRAGARIGSPDEAHPGSSYITTGDLTSLARKSLNGRVIKQLVRGAQALSIAEKEPLGMSHIHIVLGITEQFEADWKELEFTENIDGEEGKQEVSMYS